MREAVRTIDLQLGLDRFVAVGEQNGLAADAVFAMVMEGARVFIRFSFDVRWNRLN